MYRSAFFVALFFSIPLLTLSQTILSAQGGTYSKDNITIDFTIGESLINTYSTETQQIGQGFHQDLLRITAVDVIDPNIEIKIFPNPVVNVLNIHIDKLDAGMGFFLTTVDGKKVDRGHLNPKSTAIDFSKLAQGNYVLSIIGAQDRLIKSYQIFKNQ